ncbi:exo-alpha-sialidase [Methylomagnum sp.]
MLRPTLNAPCFPAVWLAGGLAWAFSLAAQAQPATAPTHPAIEGLTDVKSLDVTAESGTLHALLVGDFTQRQRVAVAYVYSTDGGRSWSRPAFVAPEDAPPAISRRGNDARLAVRGRTIVAAWQAKSGLPGTGPIAIAVSADGGKTWRPGANPAVGDSTHNQSQIAVALDHAGHVHLAWLDDREENGNTQGLRHAKSTNGGRHWQPETTVDATTCTCCWTRLTSLPDHSLLLLYRDDAPHDMRLAGLGHGQDQWRDRGAVGQFGWDFMGCPHCGGGLAVTGAGRGAVLHSAVWTGQDQVAGLYYLRSTDSGAHWSDPMKVAGDQARESDIAAQPDGAVGLAFIPGRTAEAAVHFQVSRDAGRHWSTPTPLAAPGTRVDHPRVAATSQGFRVFWTEARQGGGKTWAMAAPSI